MENIEDLLLRAKSGDRSAINRLLETFRPVLCLIAQQSLDRKLRGRADASDIVQVTELEAYGSLGEFRGSTVTEFSAWLKQILRRNAMNLARDQEAQKRDVRRDLLLGEMVDASSLSWLNPISNETSPSFHLMSVETAILLAAALKELPENQRIAVEMRHIEGRSLDEIARSLKKTTPSAAGLLRRGLQTLRNRLEHSASWL